MALNLLASLTGFNVLNYFDPRKNMREILYSDKMVGLDARIQPIGASVIHSTLPASIPCFGRLMNTFEIIGDYYAYLRFFDYFGYIYLVFAIGSVIFDAGFWLNVA